MNTMTMTTEAESVNIGLAGTGTATIDWGDGSPNETVTLSEDDNFLESFFNRNCHSNRNCHTYTSATKHTITVSGDNITDLDCSGNKITTLDISDNLLLGFHIYDVKNITVIKNLWQLGSITDLFDYKLIEGTFAYSKTYKD